MNESVYVLSCVEIGKDYDLRSFVEMSLLLINFLILRLYFEVCENLLKTSSQGQDIRTAKQSTQA
jgi:hypothetical protein